MALLKRNPGLSEQIPEDVLERARRAGAEDLDWYAGRLDIRNDDQRRTDTPAGEREELEAIAERHRTDSAAKVGGGVGALALFRFLGRILPRTARPRA